MCILVTSEYTTRMAVIARHGHHCLTPTSSLYLDMTPSVLFDMITSLLLEFDTINIAWHDIFSIA